jgi:hypothetical protein
MQVTLFAPVAKGGRDEALSVVKEPRVSFSLSSLARSHSLKCTEVLRINLIIQQFSELMRAQLLARDTIVITKFLVKVQTIKAMKYCAHTVD